jgi:hypothetical protein
LSLNSLALLLLSPRGSVAGEPVQTGRDYHDYVNFADFGNLPNWLWLSSQANFIAQFKPAMHAQYSGLQSLPAGYDNGLTRLLTLYTGLRLTPTTNLIFDLEEAGGKAVGGTFGLAGYVNQDAVRNPSLSKDIYVPRVMLHQVIPLSDERVPVVRTPLSFAPDLPVRRLELRVGKFSAVDFFDVNIVGGDIQHQFMNWTVVNNGAYDYAADIRGYTFGVVIEYVDHWLTFRFGEMLMPRTVANDIDLQFDITKARAHNAELELRYSEAQDRVGNVRFLYYLNQGNMGSYTQAINGFRAGLTPVPDVTNHPLHTTNKYGFGVSWDQEVTHEFTVFSRLGWNDGRREEFAYTEVDRTLAVGGDLEGELWGRPYDKIGVAYVINALSAQHREYLALGGIGGLTLGDGALHYGTERILETYYRLTIWRKFAITFDFQYIVNPGYNQDRGPALVPGFRIHLDEVLGRT